jgi:hypothetical protein
MERHNRYGPYFIFKSLDQGPKFQMSAPKAPTQTDKGIRAGALFILFHKRVCGPLAHSLFQHRPEDRSPQPAKNEKAYHQADKAVQHLIDLLAA